MTGDTGLIRSPYHPQAYPHDRECIYTIRQPIGKAILLNFTEFDIEGPSYWSGCIFDYVEVSVTQCRSLFPKSVVWSVKIQVKKFLVEIHYSQRHLLHYYQLNDIMIRNSPLFALIIVPGGCSADDRVHYNIPFNVILLTVLDATAEGRAACVLPAPGSLLRARLAPPGPHPLHTQLHVDQIPHRRQRQ